MNALMEELELNEASPDADAKNAKLGGCAPEGKYHARLVEYSEKATKNAYRMLDELKFEILHGAFTGKVVEDALFHDGDTPEKTTKAKLKRRSYYHRLGLLTKTVVNGESKYAMAPNKSDLRDCLGAQCIIDVTVEDEQFENDKGKIIKMKKNKLAYWGVYALDDPEVKDVPRATGSATALPKPTAVAAVDLEGI